IVDRGIGRDRPPVRPQYPEADLDLPALDDRIRRFERVTVLGDLQSAVDASRLVASVVAVPLRGVRVVSAVGRDLVHVRRLLIPRSSSGLRQLYPWGVYSLSVDFSGAGIATEQPSATPHLPAAP